MQRPPGMEERCASTPSKHQHLEYRYLTEFQSHDPEFDYLKSLEIEEKINKVHWVDHNSAAQLILSTNDKTVKLWKVQQHISCWIWLKADYQKAGEIVFLKHLLS